MSAGHNGSPCGPVALSSRALDRGARGVDLGIDSRSKPEGVALARRCHPARGGHPGPHPGREVPGPPRRCQRGISEPGWYLFGIYDPA